MNNSKLTVGVALVAVIIAIGALYVAFHNSVSFGAGTGPQHYQEESFLQGLQIGSRGTDLKALQKGTCSMIAASFTIAATSSVPVDCAVAGAVSGDTVFAGLATSTAVYGGWEVINASASSTPGFITLRLVNNTGASAVIPASIASSTPYLLLR